LNGLDWPYDAKGMAADTLIDIMRRDKKAVGKWPQFVLLKELERCIARMGQWAVEVPQEVIESILQELCR